MTVVLHTCCGPCASACVPRLIDDGHEVTMLFANSNIDTREEFEKRKAEAEKLAKHDGGLMGTDPSGGGTPSKARHGLLAERS